MKAFLKGSAEEINFENQQVEHFLVFQQEDGVTFRLPVGEGTTHALVTILTTAPAVVSSTTASSVPANSVTVVPGPAAATFTVPTATFDEGDATTFGGDDQLPSEDSESLEDPPSSPSFEVHDPSESQPSEDEVESL